MMHLSRRGEPLRTYTVARTSGGHETWEDVVCYDCFGGGLFLYGEIDGADNSGTPRYYLKISYPPTEWAQMWEDVKEAADGTGQDI